VAKRNYTNIKIFKDGIPGWKAAGFSVKRITSYQDLYVPTIEPEKLNAALDQYLIIDIRPVNAYKSFGYIPGSRAMPLPYLSLLAAELPKEKRLVVADHNGKRCEKAAQWLLGNGFQDVTLLKNGLTGYADAGFAMEK
jgi:rhodanese-related sulfurtransferase